MARILLVGGAGYIGSVLTDYLLKNNHEVVVVDNLLYNNEFALYGMFGKDNFSFYRMDFKNITTEEPWFKGTDTVILLASLVGDPICKKYPEQCKYTNEISTMNFLDRLNNTDIKNLIFFSTCSNYGLRDSDILLKEEDALEPISLYANTKVNVERYLLDENNKWNFSPIILRLATAYGFSYRMRFDLTIADFVYELLKRDSLEIYDYNTQRPYVNVWDVAEFIGILLKSDLGMFEREVFNIGRNEYHYSKKELVDIILTYIPDKSNKVVFVEKSVDPRNYRVDFSKVKNTFNWEPVRTVENFIENLVNVLKEGLFENKEYFGNYSIKTEIE